MHRKIRLRKRRSAAEWKKLVTAWKRSGKTSAKFARSVGVAPRTLVWWRWRLARDAKQPKRRTRAAKPAPKLVAVEIDERTDVAEPGVAWEIENARGDVLRVRATIAPNDLASVIAAFTAREDPHR